MKKIIPLTMLFLLGATMTVFAQTLKVTSFNMRPQDITPSRFPKEDINGIPCGLIKVWLPMSDVKFVGNVIDYSCKNGEWWVYMTNGSKRVTIKTTKYPPLSYEFGESIKSNVTYVMTVELPNKSFLKLNGNTELLSLATLTIDGKEEKYEVEKPYELGIGAHKVCVLLDCYEPFERTVTFKGGETDILDIVLTPTCKEIELTTGFDYADIYVDGQFKGNTVWKKKLSFGSYEVETRSKGCKSSKVTIYVNEHTPKRIILPYPRPYNNFILANVAYGFAPQLSWGISYGAYTFRGNLFPDKYYGWFVCITSNYNIVSKVGDCDAEGFLIDGSYPEYNGTQKRSRLSIMAGGLLPLFGDYSHIRIGVGYGTRNLYWETNDGLYYKNLGYSTDGFDGSIGLQFRFERVVISADYVVTNFKVKQFSEIKIGAGITF